MRPGKGLRRCRRSGSEPRAGVRSLFDLRSIRSLDEMLPVGDHGYRPVRHRAAANPSRRKGHFYNHRLQGIFGRHIRLALGDEMSADETGWVRAASRADLRAEEHKSELQSLRHLI